MKGTWRKFSNGNNGVKRKGKKQNTTLNNNESESGVNNMLKQIIANQETILQLLNNQA